MSDGMRISRRRILQLGVLAPLAALKAEGASAEEIAAAAQRLARIPSGTMQKVKGKAKNHCDAKPCQGYKAAKFETVAGVLWTYFSTGVAHAGATLPQEASTLEGLILAAYDMSNAGTASKKSGDLIAERIKDWKGSYENVTNYCAFRCGLHAAEVVGVGAVVDEAAYKIAFEKTQGEMTFIMNKVRYHNGDRGPFRGGGC